MLKNYIRERAQYILSKIDIPGSFYMAGGCFNDQIRDIDIFGYNGQGLSHKVIVQTKNATTYATQPWPTQICNYTKPTLNELLESFDFAHVQVGVEVRHKVIVAIGWTQAFEDARLTQQTWYTGSAYPLASLFRHDKYKNRGLIKNIKPRLAILTDIIRRGFEDYEDFKDQLDAVDLGLLPEDYKDAQDELLALFEVLKK